MIRRKIPQRPTRGQASRQPLQLAKEVRSIQRRAAEHDGRVVTIGPLVLFSTDTGDAWLLDPADQLAVRLAYDGDPLPVHFDETDTQFAIAWQGSYRVEGGTFVYTDKGSQRVTAIQGYPIRSILRAIDKMTYS